MSPLASIALGKTMEERLRAVGIHSAGELDRF